MCDSFMVVPSSQVRVACEAYFEDRNNRIAEVREELIAKEMAPRSGFWGWLFPAARTREEAIYNLRDSGDRMMSDWQLPEVSGGAYAAKVQDLLDAACRFPNGSVHVSVEMVSFLDNFWE